MFYFLGLQTNISSLEPVVFLANFPLCWKVLKIII